MYIHYNLHTLHIGPHIYITHILYMYVMSVHVATMHPVHVVLNRDDTDNFKR